MNAEQIGGIVRAVLAGIGGWFVAKGTITESMLTAIVGAVVTLVTVAWSMWTNKPGTVIPEKP